MEILWKGTIPHSFGRNYGIFRREKKLIFKYFAIHSILTTQKMKFSINDFFSKCDQIHSFLQIWSHLLKNSLMENFIFYAVSAIHALA